MAGIIVNGEVIRFVAPLQISSNQPVFVSDAINLRRTTGSRMAQRWEISTNLEPSNDSANYLIHSVANGYNTVFSVEMPQVYRMGVINAVTGTALSSAAASAANIIQISGISDHLPLGEFIKFGNHDKVYVVLARSGSNYTIFPRLITNVPINTQIYFGNSVIMKARYDIDTAIGISYRDGILSDPGTIKLIEAF